jgi:hypothetical protein
MQIAARAGMLLAAGFIACGEAKAQQPTPYDPPRTVHGAPDMQGIWAAHFITPLERPDGVADLIVPPEKAPEVVAKLAEKPDGVYDPDADYFIPDKLLKIGGELRSSWVVEPRDGRLPYTALAKLALKRAEELSETSFDNPEERPGGERCVASLGHPPMHAASIVIPYQIVQTPEAVIVATEDTDSARVIHLSGPRPPAVVRTRAGYSAGHWEGDTLVVETTHLAADGPSGALHRYLVVVGEGSRIIERFTLTSDTELLYQFTVEDSDLYNRPWRAEFILTRLNDHVYEYACHEGNRGMTSILTAARMDRQKPSKK